MQFLEEFIFNLRLELHIKGIVQGVGFRPFIYQLAKQNSLSGFIYNNSAGVVIEIEGTYANIDTFNQELDTRKPSLSRIDFIKTQKISLQNTKKFEILQSHSSEAIAMLSPDIALCKECEAEMQDENNRRYKYPFINCTNCGPRYSIINNLPYDREKTTMDTFCMCKICKAEYLDIEDRRYHAQAISCFKCGPKLHYKNFHTQSTFDDTLALKSIIDDIKDAKITAIKGLGGFHIVCDATNESAVLTLRVKKRRKTKPFAVMFSSLQEIEKVCILTYQEREILLSKEKPIVLVQKKASSYLANSLAPNINKLGVFLAYTPLHILLLEALKIPLIATSANLSDEPIIYETAILEKKLSFVVDSVLTHNRKIVNACDDSVMLYAQNEPIMIRMARAYTPFSIMLSKKIDKCIVALGANQKVSISFSFGEYIILSPHIGDLNSIESFEYFTRTMETFFRIYNIEIDTLVCDKHPKYETTKWAKQYIKEHKNVKLLEVQHHYAHALACMAEHSLEEDVLAFCFDGTGYGDDSKLWGGEVFIANPCTYKRVYHFKELTLLGGEKAIKQARRVALAYLFDIFTLDEILLLDSDVVKSYTSNEIKTFFKMYTRGINAPKSSSVGRIFDAVYAFCGFLQDVHYEGESGMILEALSEDSNAESGYNYTLSKKIINTDKMLHEILKEEKKEDISKKFMISIANIILDISEEYPHLPVVLSGGVFQNKVLTSMIIEKLKDKNKKYYIQNKTPINDGGISLGQAYFALHKKGL